MFCEQSVSDAQNPGALSLVAQRLLAIDTRLETRVPSDEIRQAIEDVFQTYGLVSQLKEVYESQRDQLVILVGLAAQLLADARHGDQELRDLLIQLRELGRKHVRGLSDLERAQNWHEVEAERRDGGDGEAWKQGDAERRKASGF